MSIIHANITDDTELHNPKGFSGASNETQLIKNESGTLTWIDSSRYRTGWRDMTAAFTAATINPAGVNAPDFIKIKDNGAGSTGVFGYAFDASAVEELFLTFHVDHDYKYGTAFYPHIHWLPTNTNTGTVRWGIEWTAARGHTQEAFGNTVITYIEQAAPGIAYQHMVAEVGDPGVFVPNAEPDMCIIARVFRDATHANDTYNADAFGIFLDAHYQTDRNATANRSPNFTDGEGY